MSAGGTRTLTGEIWPSRSVETDRSKIPDGTFSATGFFGPSGIRRETDSSAVTIRAFELHMGLAFVLIGGILRALFLLHQRVNSDEPQHLYVAWAWIHGLLPYRDVFDNHAPIFSMIMAPVLAMLGERADIVTVMRIAMVPCVAIGLGAMWWTARALFSARAALWALAIVTVEWNFLRASVEYRTDQLWMALWLVALAVVSSGRLARGRCLAAGLLLGTTLGTSLKTVLLLLALLGSSLTTWALMNRGGRRPPFRSLVSRAGLVLLGLVAVPALLAGYFAVRGAWRPFVYDTVLHNLVPGLGQWRVEGERLIAFPLLLPLLIWGARRAIRRTPDHGLGARRAMVLLTAGYYEAILEGFWPLVTRQDVLPLVPMIAMVAAWMLTEPPGVAHLGGSKPVRSIWMAPAAALLAAWSLARTPGWSDHVSPEVGFLNDVLRVTRPDDRVMDLKGESIYRLRPTDLVFETVTLERIRRSLIRDDTAERVIAGRTPVAVLDRDELPESTRAFLDSNYVSVGRLRVLGTWLDARGEADGPRRFDIRVPQRYAVAGERGSAHGWLDDCPYDGPRELSAGPHLYQPELGEGRLAVMWAQALERGFTPFEKTVPP